MQSDMQTNCKTLEIIILIVIHAICDNRQLRASKCVVNILRKRASNLCVINMVLLRDCEAAVDCDTYINNAYSDT